MSRLIFPSPNEASRFRVALKTISKMKVQDKRASITKRNAFYAIAPLNYYLRFFALDCIYRDGSKLKQFWSLTKNVFWILIFGVINAFSLYQKLCIYFDGTVTHTFEYASQVIFLLGYLQYLVDLIYVYKCGRDMSLEYYKIYNYIDIVLGMTKYGESRRSIINLLFFFIAVISISTGLDFSAWYVVAGPIIFTAYGIEYVYYMLRHLSMADPIAQAIQVECRLRVMGDIIEELFLATENLPGVLKDVIADQTNLDRMLFDKGKMVEQQKFKITKLCSCYLLLLEQCDYINKAYGVRILGIYLSQLMDMITCLNFVIRFFIGSMSVPYYYRALLIVSSGLRVWACAAVLLYQMYRCEQCYTQVDRIIRYIDYLLINKKIAADIRWTLQSLRSLAISRPVRFHAAHFFQLDYALLLSVASVVVTYTIIMLQNIM